MPLSPLQGSFQEDTSIIPEEVTWDVLLSFGDGTWQTVLLFLSEF
jgi:hypothetical protein